jgi:hypothetical protein
MDDRSFDALVKAVASGASRRSLLKGMLGLGGAALTGGALLEGGADAARRPTPTPTPVRCPGQQTPLNGQCTCPAGLSKCGPDCCNPTAVGASHSECCDNACCFGHCYGEELCCPYPRTFCPGSSGDADGECCPEAHLCCGAGTPDRYCLAPAVGACCDDSDCPVVGTACGACVDNLCVASPCGDCEACSNGECVGCEQAGYACCNNDDVCVECCSSEQCGPYFDCDLYICEPCEVEGRVPCGEPPCIEGPGNRANCCCEACGADADCGSCQVCFEGACRNCAEVGLECFGGTCGECGSSEDCGPYFDCDLFICEPCETEGKVACGQAPCPDYSINCCCEACAQESDCGSCLTCSQGACVSCEAVGLECFGGTCGQCGSSGDCGPYFDCDLFMCLTCEQAGLVRCGEPPCDDRNCCCEP